MNNFVKKCKGSQDTHLCSVTFSENLAVFDNVKKYCRAGQGTDGNIIRRMRFSCWVTMATDTHSECTILTAFPLRQRLR